MFIILLKVNLLNWLSIVETVTIKATDLVNVYNIWQVLVETIRAIDSVNFYDTFGSEVVSYSLRLVVINYYCLDCSCG